MMVIEVYEEEGEEDEVMEEKPRRDFNFIEEFVI